MPDAGSNTITTLFQYLTESVIPVLIPVAIGGMFFVWTASNDVSHAQKDIDRIAAEHNSRIMANQISIRNVDNKVARIEASVSQILHGIDKTCKDMKSINDNIAKVNGSILVLLDREKRRDIKTSEPD